MFGTQDISELHLIGKSLKDLSLLRREYNFIIHFLMILTYLFCLELLACLFV